MKAWEEDLSRRLVPDDRDLLEDAPAAAVALILRRRDGPEVLLIERVHREGDPWSGQVALPGGMKAPHDVSLSAIARRETMEEVSVDVGRSCLLLGRLPDIRPVNVPELVVYPFVYSLQTDVLAMAGEEVRGAFWTPLAEIRRSEATRRVEVRGREIMAPSFLHEERIIWGLTYRILVTLFDLGVGL